MVTTYKTAGYFAGARLKPVLGKIPAAIVRLALSSGDEHLAWECFRAVSPRMARAIPSAKRGDFLAGLHRAHEQGKVR